MATYRLPAQHDRRTNELHPLVYRGMIGLTIWLVLPVWALFSRGAYEGVTLSVSRCFSSSLSAFLCSLADLATKHRCLRAPWRHANIP
jgi:hypothetical protein